MSTMFYPPKKKGPPGSIDNPLPGGTYQIPPPGQWKAADPTPFEGVRYPAGRQPTVSAAEAGGGGGGGGFVDPGYAQFAAQLRAMGALDASQRQQAVQQALIRFGLVPENLKDPYGDVTDLVRSLAGEKTTAGLSTYARIQDWNKQVLSRLRKALAARGALRSGELGFGLERQDLGYRQTFDDATSQLLDYISGAQYAFAQGEIGRAMQQGSALQSLPSSFFSGPAPAPVAAAPSPAYSQAVSLPSVRSQIAQSLQPPSAVSTFPISRPTQAVSSRYIPY